MAGVRHGLLALAVLGMSACGKPRSSPAQGEAEASAVAVCGQIVFASGEAEHHDGQHEHISMVAASGGGVTKLLADDETSSFPAAVSPDGRSLLILSSKPRPDGRTSDRFSLLEFSAAGEPLGEPRVIGPEGAALRNPSWAPDGSYLVFESDAESFRDLYRLDLGSDAVLRLTHNPEGNFEPVVSPDGQQIAFVSSRDGDAEIYVMSADGGEPRRLTDSRGDDTGPTWSPDGRRLAFASGRERSRGHDAFVLELGLDDARVEPAVRDGSRAEPVFVRDLVVSPTGDRLAFTEQVAARGVASIVIAELDTGRVLARTSGPVSPSDRVARRVDEQPSWAPDGAHLVFARSESGRSNIVRVDSEGGAAALLTSDAGVHWLPRWLAGPSCPRAAAHIEMPGAG